MKKAAASFCVCVLGTLALHAQAPNLDERIAQLSSITKSSVEYQLGPGDLIEINVFGVESFKQTLRISAAGMIKLPLLDPVVAGGLTPAQLEDRLTEVLKGEVIKDPQVSVFVREYRSQPVFILGAVRTPGQYQMSLQLNFVDVLSMAGGLGNAGDEAVIQRRNPDTGVVDIIKVDLKRLLDKSDLSLNVPIKGGDVINIQERLIHTVYVVGEVNRAGAFQLPPKQDLRVSQLVAWAGGPMKTAKMSDGILVRYDEKGVRQQLPVNFADILKGKTDDFMILPDDIIFVPGSKFKNFTQSLLATIPGSVAQVPYIFRY